MSFPQNERQTAGAFRDNREHIGGAMKRNWVFIALLALGAAVVYFLLRQDRPPTDDWGQRIDFAVHAASEQCLLNATSSEKRVIEATALARLKDLGVGGSSSIEKKRRSVSDVLSESAQLQQDKDLRDCMIRQTDHFLGYSTPSPTPAPAGTAPPDVSTAPPPTPPLAQTASPTFEAGSGAAAAVDPSPVRDAQQAVRRGDVRSPLPPAPVATIAFGPRDYATRYFTVVLEPCALSGSALDCLVRVTALTDRAPRWWIDKRSMIEDDDGVPTSASWGEAQGVRFYNGSGGRSVQLSTGVPTLIRYHFDGIADPGRVRAFTLTFCCTTYHAFLRER